MGNQQESCYTFRKIPFACDYMVSDCGKVYSTKSSKFLKFSTVAGYKRVPLICNDGTKKKYLVHRLVAIVFLGDLSKEGFEVNHINCDKANNTLANLEWVSRSDNLKHAFNNKLKTVSGINNPRTTLLEQDVIDIYNYLLSGGEVNDVMQIYGLSRSAVSSIKRKKNWKEILEELPNIEINKKSLTISKNMVSRVIGLRDIGLTYQNIADKLGLTLHQVEGVFRKRRTSSSTTIETTGKTGTE